MSKLAPLPVSEPPPDIELATMGRGQSSALDSEHDPLLLRSSITHQDKMSELRQRGRSANKVVSFYTAQNQHITSLLKPLKVHVEEANKDEEDHRLGVKIAVYGALIANCCLAVIQLYAAISSLSLSFFATASDSVFDPAANVILNYCHRRAARVDRTKYPAGGARFETVGDLTYSFAMGMVSVILIAFSIQDIATHKGDEVKEFHVPAVVAVCVAFGTKLALAIYSYFLRTKSSQVEVLYRDHRNDLLVNGFGILTNAGGAKLAWWIDPSGALCISVFLVIIWSRTAITLFKNLVGVAAPPEFQNLITYKAMLFADDIVQIDSCVAYTSGSNYIVEVDIVMDRDTPLHRAHDVSQALQDAIEELSNVERAHVHVDWETHHAPEHRKKE